MARRLAAIMFTDMVGSTQLAQKDERSALELIEEQEKLARPVLSAHHGRWVKSTGDGLLAEFASALDAVECAVELQGRVHERNQRTGVVPLQIRIGVHLGDVQRRGGDIFGDAVNVASRIEPLAEPGGVCLSEPVYVQVQNKVPYQLAKVGPKNLKGVRESVDVYRVRLPWIAEGPSTNTSTLHRLAVLPLANISSDPENEYFADGLTEELITVLSQLNELRVIARTSMMSYKSSPKTISQIGSELGVGAILEGSVRRAGDRVRITAQLIDVGSEEHTWAATFDRKLDDVFAIQTEVAKQIADALKVRVSPVEANRLEELPTVRPESYLEYLKGRSLLASAYTTDALIAAKERFERAISLDASNARAYAGLAGTFRHLVWWAGDNESRSAWDREGRSNARRAVELGPNLAESHFALAELLWEERDYPSSEEEFRRALVLSPNFADAHASYANLLMDEGRTDEGIREIELAEELNPLSQLILSWHVQFLTWMRRAEEAITVAERIGRTYPGSAVYHVARSGCCLLAGDFAGAVQEVTTALTLEPSGTLRVWLALTLAAAGDRERALPMLKEFEHLGRSVNRTSVLAGGYALLGDFDQAFRFLFEGLDDHELSFQAFRNDPSYEPLRRDPRFAQLLRRMHLDGQSLSAGSLEPPRTG